MILPNTDIDVDYPEFDFLPFGDYQLAHSDVSLLWPSMGSIASRIFEIEGTVSPKDLFTPPAEDMTSTWVNNTCFPSSPPAEHDNPFELDTSDEVSTTRQS